MAELVSLHRAKKPSLLASHDRRIGSGRAGWGPTPENPLIISASELRDFLRCRVRWWWRHQCRLIPAGGAAPLELPDDCEPARGQVYRTHYVVQPDGRVTEPRSSDGDGCVQQALRAWVSSFRYGPVDAEMPVVIDWIAVTATRGG